MSVQLFRRLRSPAMLLLMSVVTFPAAADERGNEETQQLKVSFQVTIRQGPSAGLVANGVLTLNVESRIGNFTGTLTPAEAEGTGEPQSSVLLHQVDHKFVPFGNVKEVDVRGTIHGHAINLVALNVGGEGKHLFGAGTTENAFGTPGAEQGLGHIAGPAVGPEEGDTGDWIIGIGITPIALRAPPVINSPSTATFFEFTANNSFTVTSSGAPAPGFSATGTLPSGVTFGANGLLSGNPTQIGTFPITITATNGIAPDAVQSFTLVVNRPPVTFTSPLSPTPIIVASYAVGLASTCPPLAGKACPRDFSMTVTSADNPNTFGFFVTNATKQASSGAQFSGTVAVGDMTLLTSATMIVSNVSLSGASGSSAATITISYQ